PDVVRSVLALNPDPRDRSRPRAGARIGVKMKISILFLRLTRALPTSNRVQRTAGLMTPVSASERRPGQQRADGGADNRPPLVYNSTFRNPSPNHVRHPQRHRPEPTGPTDRRA